MFGEYPWTSEIDEATSEIFELTINAIPRWISHGRSEGLSEARLYLFLALASARYTDHHGPFIGHGTFAGAPALRASAYLSPGMRDLALAQTAAYVAGVIHAPNYGPYRLMKAGMGEISGGQEQEWEERFIPDLESGEFVLLSENRAASLIRDTGSKFRTLLTHAAVRQYPENEHRLIIVHRAGQLLDDAQGWEFAEPILRPAIQYLASRPQTELAKHWDNQLPVLQDKAVPADSEEILKVAIRLREVDFGREPYEIHALLKTGYPAGWLCDALALAGSEMLLASGFDAHGVTGLHCVLDLMHDREIPIAVRSLAAVLSLSSSRTRRQKERRAQWRKFHMPDSEHVPALAQIKEAMGEDATGRLAEILAAQYLQGGGCAVSLAKMLEAKALTSSGPFNALHNIKMIHGLLVETRRALAPSLAWRHLAAGAGVVARSVERPSKETSQLLAAWKETSECTGVED